MYTARLKDRVAVLHAFQKKTETTSPRDIELARAGACNSGYAIRASPFAPCRG
ncbi:MAG: type II toxin-antitoxin system RelE/ParE family toxin [Rubrivivax sp.]